MVMKTKEQKRRNKEYMREYRKKYPNMNKENYAKNREKAKEESKKWKQDNPEKVKKYKREWYRNNPEKRRAWYRRYYSDSKKREGINQYFRERRKMIDLNFNTLIRSKTNKKFPLTNQKCIKCGGSAECHHHTTNPYQYDKFDFMCNKCHGVLHRIY